MTPKVILSSGKYPHSLTLHVTVNGISSLYMDVPVSQAREIVKPLGDCVIVGSRLLLKMLGVW